MYLSVNQSINVLQLGDIAEIRLVKNFKGKSKGYAYVEFTDEVSTLFISNVVMHLELHRSKYSTTRCIFMRAEASKLLKLSSLS